MNKFKILIIAIIALILINLITLFFCFSKEQKERQRKPPREIIIRKLHFDAQQVAAYDALINEHKATISLYDNKIKKEKNELYSQLSKPENTKVTDSIMKMLVSNINEIEKTHYNHFLAIKKLCKPEQLEDYNILTKDLAKLFSNKPPRK